MYEKTVLAYSAKTASSLRVPGFSYHSSGSNSLLQTPSEQKHVMTAFASKKLGKRLQRDAAWHMIITRRMNVKLLSNSVAWAVARTDFSTQPASCSCLAQLGVFWVHSLGCSAQVATATGHSLQALSLSWGLPAADHGPDSRAVRKSLQVSSLTRRS